MKCFNHSNNEAISVCTSCGRALCSECIKEYNDTIICNNRDFCTNRSDTSMNILENSKKVIAHNSKMLPRNEKIMKGNKILSYIFLFIGLCSAVIFITQLGRFNIFGNILNLIPVILFTSMGIVFYRQYN